jgi:hypothetical protein
MSRARYFIPSKEDGMYQPQDYAAHWLERSIGLTVETNLGTDPFLRFMYAWVGFNALYADKESTVGGDRNQVRSFAGDAHLVQIHKTLLRGDHVLEYPQSVDVIAERGVTNLRNGHVCTIRKSKPLPDVLECIYQVRCNCFHGGKEAGNARDRALVTASFVVVANLLSHYMGGRSVGGWNELLKRIEQEEKRRSEYLRTSTQQ